jgi:hypothetical protein
LTVSRRFDIQFCANTLSALTAWRRGGGHCADVDEFSS